MLYGALVVASFVTYYVDVRHAPPATIVDLTPVVAFYLPLGALLAGLLIGRWWAIVLPAVAFPVAGVMLVIGSFDDAYSAIAPDRGGTAGLDWFGLAAGICAFAVPAAALGAGLHALGRQWERKWLARRARPERNAQ